MVPLFGLMLAVSACTAGTPPASTALLVPKPVAIVKPTAPVVVAMAPVVSAGDEVAMADTAGTKPVVATAPASVGTASWYKVGRGLHRTCSGEMLNNEALTAASPTLPMGTMVRVARLDGSASVVVTVNDRMPREHRILDVTEAAARVLGLFGSGVAQVSVTPVAPEMVADSE